MSKVITFKPDQRIVAQLRQAGGITIEQGMKRAERRLESVREQCTAMLDAKIEALAAGAEDNVDASALYAGASEIFGLAATFRLQELAEAAASLCALLSRGEAQNRDLFTQSVAVHLDALRTLRQPRLSGDAAARQAVVAGLRRVAAKGKGEGQQ